MLGRRGTPWLFWKLQVARAVKVQISMRGTIELIVLVESTPCPNTSFNKDHSTDFQPRLKEEAFQVGGVKRFICGDLFARKVLTCFCRKFRLPSDIHCVVALAFTGSGSPQGEGQGAMVFVEMLVGKGAATAGMGVVKVLDLVRTTSSKSKHGANGLSLEHGNLTILLSN